MLVPHVKLLIKLIIFIILSWLLIHVMAVLGIFLAVAYPLWWLLSASRVICLVCRMKKTARCTFQHTVINSSFFLIFSIISFGVVFTESKILFKMGFPPVQKTVYFTIPPRGQYRLGEIFPMKIDINGIKKSINAVQADVSFDPQKLEVVTISTQGSFANIFIQKEINNEVGYARLTGGLPNPGFFAEHGIFGTIYFKTKSPGITKVEFLSSSLVLANDGKGSNVLKELAVGSYLILPDKISQDENNLQKSVIINPDVLGASAGETQMTFYEDRKVLGIQTTPTVEKKQSNSIVILLLSFLEKFNRFILTLWATMLHIG